jgi:hypothetical protein
LQIGFLIFFSGLALAQDPLTSAFHVAGVTGLTSLCVEMGSQQLCAQSELELESSQSAIPNSWDYRCEWSQPHPATPPHSGSPKCSQLILYLLCPRPDSNLFFEKLWLLLAKNGISRTGISRILELVENRHWVVSSITEVSSFLRIVA